MYLSVVGIRFNAAAPGQNTNIFSSSLSPVYGGYFVVTVNLATASVLNYTVTDGTTTKTCGLNGSVPLNAGDTYSFSFGVAKVDQSAVALSYNFQVETDSAINFLSVNEVAIGGA